MRSTGYQWILRLSEVSFSFISLLVNSFHLKDVSLHLVTLLIFPLLVCAIIVYKKSGVGHAKDSVPTKWRSLQTVYHLPIFISFLSLRLYTSVFFFLDNMCFKK